VVALPGNNAALVRWAALADSVSTYVIYANGSQVGTAAAGSTSAAITGLSNGTAYTFTVQAVNSTGSGPVSLASNSCVPSTGPVVGVNGLVLWLDANQLGIANGNAVNQFTDYSGNGYHGVISGTGFTTFTAGTMAAPWTNGKPAVTFNGTLNAYTLSGLTSLITGSNVTVFAVCDCVSALNVGTSRQQCVLDNYHYIASPSYDDQNGLIIDTGAGASNNWRVSNNRQPVVSQAFTLSTPVILSTTLPGFCYENGAVNSQPTNPVQLNSNFFVAGSNINNGSLALQGHIAEIIIYGQVLTQAQRWAVEAYLSAKYAISVVQN
jgi:hypothetical protein